MESLQRRSEEASPPSYFLIGSATSALVFSSCLLGSYSGGDRLQSLTVNLSELIPELEKSARGT